MTIKALDTVVLQIDLPSAGLRRGDIGAVVQVYASGQFEVEFVTATGRTQAVVPLSSEQVRTLGPQDLLAVRQIDAA